MIFSYVKYKIAPTKTIPSGEIHRPLIPIRIIGPKGEVEVFGLLDTGADNVFVSASLAEILGTDVNDEAEIRQRTELLESLASHGSADELRALLTKEARPTPSSPPRP